MNELRKIAICGDLDSLDFVKQILNDKTFNGEKINAFPLDGDPFKMLFLTSSLFDNLDKDKFREKSGVVLKEINAACRSEREDFKPVTIAHISIGDITYSWVTDTLSIT